MKNIITIGCIVLFAIVGYMIGVGLQGGEDDVAQESGERVESNSADQVGQDSDPASRVRGRVMSISDTEIIIGTYADRRGATSGGFNREQLQEMSEEDREAFRAQRQAERAAQGEPEITGEKVVTITQETIFTKGRGGFGGQRRQGGGRENGENRAQDARPEPEQIDQSDIEEGMTINVILKEGTQEADTISVQEAQ